MFEPGIDVQQDDFRFGFGKNWARYLSLINDQRISMAVDSLKNMLGQESLVGYRFLDIGSGSGLFSLAARNLGATVYSFDYDPQSVACTKELKSRYHPDDEKWTIEKGSALDAQYLGSLGRFDIVYSWGVLHHTGDMWRALENMIPMVKRNGFLFVAIYNDQGGRSQRWKKIKMIYNKLPVYMRMPYIVLIMGPREIKHFIFSTLKGTPLEYFRAITDYSHKSMRGMSYWHDLVDWIGGYPFEVAKPEEIFKFYRNHGFQLQNLRTCAGGIGCNEFVFLKTD